ncbi:NUDIX hydrolase [Microvirga antarctica]|uniref:NUDIX hydrolase n=1 Tax=Microvirga antarctica TaxID=2819233 RepID=UPI001B3039EC|nr:NUDIX hydrolase [Microvirga antarctica]
MDTRLAPTTSPATTARPEAEDTVRKPRLRPADAATLIVIDRKGRSPKLLMGKRHAGLKFMPGKFVFPGGRIEPGDARMSVVGALHARAEQALLAHVPRPSPQRGRALALAAIRETFEETGILFGSRAYGRPERVPPGSWAAFAEHEVTPDLEDLQVIARAITPSKRTKRFDTRFFAIDRRAIGHVTEGVIGPDSELVELAWVTLRQARALDLPHITRVILTDLEERLANGFGPHLPVPFYHHRSGRSVCEML